MRLALVNGLVRALVTLARPKDPLAKVDNRWSVAATTNFGRFSAHLAFADNPLARSGVPKQVAFLDETSRKDGRARSTDEPYAPAADFGIQATASHVRMLRRFHHERVVAVCYRQ
jgi:hypothetical protein